MPEVENTVKKEEEPTQTTEESKNIILLPTPDQELRLKIVFGTILGFAYGVRTGLKKGKFEAVKESLLHLKNKNDPKIVKVVGNVTIGRHLRKQVAISTGQFFLASATFAILEYESFRYMGNYNPIVSGIIAAFVTPFFSPKLSSIPWYALSGLVIGCIYGLSKSAIDLMLGEKTLESRNRVIPVNPEPQQPLLFENIAVDQNEEEEDTDSQDDLKKLRAYVKLKNNSNS